MSAKMGPAERRSRAEQVVERGRAVVERQRLLIAGICRCGGDASGAEELLKSFEKVLLKFEDDLAVIETDDT